MFDKVLDMPRKGNIVTKKMNRFVQLISLYTPWKPQKTSGFLMFSGGLEREQWHEMG